MERREHFLKKIEAGTQKEPRIGNLLLDLSTQELKNSETGVSLHLSASEYKIMWALVRAGDSFLSNDDLFEFLYEDLSDEKDLPLSNVVNTFLSRLQKKLDTLTGGQVQIANRHGYGYNITST